MRVDDVEEAHEAAIGEAFDRGVMVEIVKLSRENAGARAVLPEALARAAFWLRVYTELTNYDPAAAAVLIGLVSRLSIGVIDMSRMN